MKVKKKVRKSRDPTVGKIIKGIERWAKKEEICIKYKDDELDHKGNRGFCLWDNGKIVEIVIYLSSSERTNMLVLLHEWTHIRRFKEGKEIDIGYFEYYGGEGREGFWYMFCSLVTEVFAWKEVFEHMKKRGIRVLPSDKKMVTDCVKSYTDDLSRKVGGISEVRKTDKMIIKILGG